jgi:hypothetical protein
MKFLVAQYPEILTLFIANVITGGLSHSGGLSCLGEMGWPGWERVEVLSDNVRAIVPTPA